MMYIEYNRISGIVEKYQILCFSVVIIMAIISSLPGTHTNKNTWYKY